MDEERIKIEEQDEKEFEKWFGSDKNWQEVITDFEKDLMRQSFLASRKVLREKENMDEEIKEIEERLDVPCSTSVEVSLRILAEKLIFKIKELKAELKLNTSMLARQCDLTREPEIKVMKKCKWQKCWWSTIIVPGECSKKLDMTNPNCPMFLDEEKKLKEQKGIKCWCQGVKNRRIIKGDEWGDFEVYSSKVKYCPDCGKKLNV